MAVVQRMAIVQRLVQNTSLSYTRFSRAGDSGRPLLTGGRCSEVAVSTGLTVHVTYIIEVMFKKLFYKLYYTLYYKSYIITVIL